MKKLFDMISNKKININITKKNLILVGICLLVLLFVIIFPGIISFVFGNHLSDKPVVIQSETSTKTDYTVYKDGLLAVKADGVVFYDKKGNEKWSIGHTFLTPFVNVSGNYIIASDVDGADAFVIKDGEIQYSIEAENPVTYSYVNKNGYSVVITSETGYKSLVNVYDKTGSNIYKWYSGEWNITDAVIADNNKHMAVSGIDTSGREVSSVITLFDIDKENYTGQIKLENTLTYKLSYSSLGLVVLNDSSVLCLDKKGRVKREFSLSGKKVNAFDVSDTGKIILAVSDNDEEGDGNKVIVLSSWLNKKKEVNIDFEAEFADYSKGKILVVGKDKLCVIGKSGRKILKHTLNKEPDYASMAFGGKKVVTFSAGNANIHNISLGRR